MMTYEKSVVVGLGEMEVTKEQSAVLTSVGVGSCIVVCAYDPVSKVGGMAHLVLPKSDREGNRNAPARYVNTGIPMLFREMTRQGAIKSRLVVKIVGGARMLIIPGLDAQLNIGERNITEARASLAEEGISLAAADIGGNYGRTVQLFLDSGKVTVKTVGGENVEL